MAVSGQNYYWIGFTDKHNSEFSLDNPEAYLSVRAIERRNKQNVPIDSLDLPVNQFFIDSVLTLDVEFVHASKWLNGMTVSTEIENLGDILADWTFIDYIQRTKVLDLKSATSKFNEELITHPNAPIDTTEYGGSVHQVSMLQGEFLHQRGFKGEGMHIAVLDAGFLNADIYPAFDSLWAGAQILGTRDFVEPESDFFGTHYHGMSVLSCMGGNIPGELIGTAPEASYWLLRSEDADSEFMIEEDNWVVAAEFADSVGCDIINSSLGYYEFDDPSTDHDYSDMDGKTARVTKGANIAASRGMLVFASAGNERNDSWFRIIAPSDGDKVIGVGAVDANLQAASFSSAGPAANGDIKPNVAAMGYRSTAQLSNGNVGLISGTSFSSPILAGMAASLWQMFPEKTAVEIKEAIELSGSQYNSPDSLLGYGIPNMQTAAELLGYVGIEKKITTKTWKVYPNPVHDYVVLQTQELNHDEVSIELFSASGNLIKAWQKKLQNKTTIDGLSEIPKGIYFIRITDQQSTTSIKITKIDQ